MPDYDAMTSEELQAELRRLGRKVSGSRAKLIERLREAGGQEEKTESAASTERGEQPSLGEIGGRIRREFSNLSGLEVERLSALREREEGWLAHVDVVEVRRIPPSTDVMASYEVLANSRGEVQGYERIRRFHRAEGGQK